MALAKDNHVVNAFPPDRPDQPLRISVLPRRPRGCGAIADAHGANTSDEYLAIGSIAVTDEVAWSLVPSAGLSELPGNPFRCGSRKSDPAGFARRDRNSASSHQIIPRSRGLKLSNTIIRKGLAFDRHWSGTVINPGREGRSEILPRRLDGQGGASVVRREPRQTERRISMTKSAKKRSVALPAKPVPSATSSEEIAQVSEGRSADPGSKQARLIAMLQSPAGATILLRSSSCPTRSDRAR